MAQMTEMKKYVFRKKEDRDRLENIFPILYPDLRTNSCSTHQNGEDIFLFFVENKKSLLFDLNIDQLMRTYNCCSID